MKTKINITDTIQYARPLAILLICDALTKYLAVAFLVQDKYLQVVGSHFSLRLSFNTMGMGSISYIFSNGNLSPILISAVVMILLAGFAILLSRSKWPIITRVLIWFLGFFIIAGILPIVSKHIVVPSTHRISVVIIKGISGIIFYVTMFTISKKTLFRMFSILSLAAALGNTFFVRYSDWAGIDFMTAPALFKTIHLTTFNFADIYLYSGILVLVVFPIIEIIKKMANRFNADSGSESH